jgi:hypothetical protein
MEQRVYQGNINPNGLADYLVNTFNQGYGLGPGPGYGFNPGYGYGYGPGFSGTMAQKVGQGDNILVQIALLGHHGRRIRSTIGLSITRVPDGVSVATGQSNWFDAPAMAGGLIGAIFWPPLLLFPLARGIRDYGLYQDVWNAVDTYCTQVGAMQASSTTAHGVYCPRCGAVNDEDAPACAMCGTPLASSFQGQPQPTSVPNDLRNDFPSQSPQSPPAAAAERIICPACGQTVSGGKFCSNCGAPLTPGADQGS